MKFRTEKEILISMIAYAQEGNLISTDNDLLTRIENGEQTENQYVLLLSAIAHMGGDIESLAEEIYQGTNINNATGEQLDTIGKIFHVPRILAQSPLVEIVCTSPTSVDEDIVIPAGTGLIVKEIYQSYGEYVTMEEARIEQGTDSVRIICEGDGSYMEGLPISSVTGIKGFDTISATNPERGTNGCTIEEDDKYRERIRSWPSLNLRGTRDCIESYLDEYEGVNAYKLVPHYDGGGTLKIVVDALPSVIEVLGDNLYNDCMLLSDYPPLVIPPVDKVVSDFSLDVVLKDVVSYTADELVQIINSMVNVYMKGGITRTGARIRGLGIGESLSPSLLSKFLLEEIPEIANILFSTYHIIHCPEDSRLVLENIEVNII